MVPLGLYYVFGGSSDISLALALLLSMALGVFLTGALHEDGLADCADGFWGAADPERRLKIMRDSHVGVYGIIALIFCFGFRFLLLWGLFYGAENQMKPLIGVMIVAANSRALLPLIMAKMAPARKDGLSVLLGRPSDLSASLAILIAIGFSTFGFGLQGLFIFGSVIPVIWLFLRVARSKIGGQTGDVLGACQILAEISGLFALMVLLKTTA